jgi:hypothetical protein
VTERQVRRWNVFDFSIVVATWVLVPVQYALGDNDTVGRLVRIFRIARPMRVIRTVDGGRRRKREERGEVKDSREMEERDG